jgi:hypothetical protein
MRRFSQMCCTILALTALAAHAEEPAAPADAAHVSIMKVYPVADLVVPLRGSDSTSVEPDFESLIDLIELRTGADCWAEGGAGSLDEHAKSLSLVVRQTNHVHQRIADILDELRHTGDVALQFDAVFLEGSISKLNLATPGRSLTGLVDEAGRKLLLEQARAIPEIKTPYAPKLTTFSGMTGMVKAEGQFELELNGVASRDGRYVRLWISAQHSEHAVRTEILIPDGYSAVREIIPGKMLAVISVKILDSAQPEEALATLPHPMPAQRYDVPEHDHPAEDAGHIDGAPQASPGDLRPPVQNAELPADDVRQGKAEPRQGWSHELAARDFGSAIGAGPKFVGSGIILFGNVHTGVTANIPIIVAEAAATIDSFPASENQSPARKAWNKTGAGAAGEAIRHVLEIARPTAIASPLPPNAGRNFASVLPWTSDVLHSARSGLPEGDKPKRLPILFEQVDPITDLKLVSDEVVTGSEIGVARLEDSIDYFASAAPASALRSPITQCSGESGCGIAFTSAHAALSPTASPFESQISNAVASLRDAGMQNEANELERFCHSLVLAHDLKRDQRIHEIDQQMKDLRAERDRLQGQKGERGGDSFQGDRDYERRIWSR